MLRRKTMFRGGRSGIAPLGSGGGAGFGFGAALAALGVAALAFLLTSGVLPGIFG